MSIEDNVKCVRERIAAACERAGRKNDVTLVTVTKTVEPERIKEAVAAGCTLLGENRVQELCEKYDKIDGVSWHVIGHLQTNKVRHAVGKAALIHSVDSFELAKEIQKRAAAKNIVQDILLEINISGEISKYGLTTGEIDDIINKIRELDSVRMRGFMTMAPKADNPDEVRWVFKKARELFDAHDEFDILSMGMSGDYVAAVEEGATMVRVGSAIFGKRPANPLTQNP